MNSLQIRKLTYAALFLALAMVFSFTACGGGGSDSGKSVIDEIKAKLEEAGVSFSHKEGYREGEWILMDYGDCVLHVFTRDSREYYALEQLWGDAELTPYED